MSTGGRYLKIGGQYLKNVNIVKERPQRWLMYFKISLSNTAMVTKYVHIRQLVYTVHELSKSHNKVKNCFQLLNYHIFSNIFGIHEVSGSIS